MAEEVKVSHPEKILFPDDGITKGELVEYYATVAPTMLPHIRGRPVTQERYPGGIGYKGFMQKDTPKYFPKWIKRVRVEKKGGSLEHVVCEAEADIVYLANQNCITPHVWTSRAPDLWKPDELIVDLDPSSEDFAVVRKAALLLRELLDELGLPSLVKTSGSRGLHIVVPLVPSHGFDVVGATAHAIAQALVERAPDDLTTEFAIQDREGRLFVDVARNAYGSMTAAVYSVRARPGAPVSMPLTWDEVESAAADARTFTIRNAVARLGEAGDLWAQRTPVDIADVAGRFGVEVP